MSATCTHTHTRVCNESRENVCMHRKPEQPDFRCRNSLNLHFQIIWITCVIWGPKMHQEMRMSGPQPWGCMWAPQGLSLVWGFRRQLLGKCFENYSCCSMLSLEEPLEYLLPMSACASLLLLALVKVKYIVGYLVVSQVHKSQSDAYLIIGVEQVHIWVFEEYLCT